MATIDDTTRKVQRILTSEFNDIRLMKDGSFSVPVGSTTAFVEPREWAPDKDGSPRTLVHIWSPLGRNVTPTPELFQWAATDGQRMYFGHVTVAVSGDGKQCFVSLDHTLLGDFLDPAELVSAIYGVLFSGDELDEIVHDRFGGKRWTDPD